MHPASSTVAPVLISLLITLAGPIAGAQQAAPTAPIASPAPAVPPAPPDLTAPPADAEKAPSGLISRRLAAGTGTQKPGPNDLVTFHFTGWLEDTKLFDSTLPRRRPARLVVGRVMPGLAEGLQLMVAGEKRRLWVPESLAFKGENGKPKGTIVLDVELIEFEPSPLTPPPDVMAPPADATKIPSGLAFKVLRPGAEGKRPGPLSRVTVHYSGWTTDGQLFDSSVLRGQPATFGLDQVIKGWTEGVQLMTPGEKRRFWIPSRLAYNNEPDKPRGMLVFDIELIAIEK
jgi:peptidylprolyl isomerase